jgi:hypothetical protein
VGDVERIPPRWNACKPRGIVRIANSQDGGECAAILRT